VSVAGNLGLIAFSVALLLGAMAGVQIAARRFALSPELQRKIVHVATGLYALSLPLTFSDTWPVVALVAVSVVVMGALRLPAVRKLGLGSAVHSVARKSYGEIYLAIAVGFLFLRAQGQPALYVIPVLVLTLADSAAALVGTSYGRRRFPIERGQKSFEGVATFFVVTVLISMIALLLLTDAPRGSVIVLAFMIGAFGALVEADSWGGLDNLFVPLGVHFLLAEHLQSSPSVIGAQAAILAVSMAAVLLLAPRFNVSRHAARSATVFIFLVCSVTYPENALLPIVALMAHFAARAFNPDRSEFPDLDFVAMAAGVSIFWLWIGEYFDRTGINLFVLTFAGVALGMTILALPRRYAAGSLVVALALGIAVEWIAERNGLRAAWFGDFRLWIAASLALAAAAPLLRLWTFERFRCPLIFAGASIAPLALYLSKGILA
jgi:dolichol kinase